MSRFALPTRLQSRLPGRGKRRAGTILVLMAALLVTLLGMLGLVIDAGIMMAQSRQAQNVADAAALAAAKALADGQNLAEARRVATSFIVSIHGHLPPTADDILSPPRSGPYAGVQGFVEVIARQDSNAYFIGFLPGMASTYSVSARAVAGFEVVAVSAAVAALDPNGRPGISVKGNGNLVVDGRIVVNSQGGGLDEDGNPINNGGSGVALSAGKNGVYGRAIDVVGGVDDPARFLPFDVGGPSPLRTGVLPEPDPLISIPIPVTSLGVDARRRGAVSINNGGASGLATDVARQNRVATVNGESVAGGLYTASRGDVILHPGIYQSIRVVGGRVFMIPGIYVIAGPSGTAGSLDLSGGTVRANGVMFYVTGSNYDAASGLPDSGDAASPPPHTDGAALSTASLNASLNVSPIDTTRYNYGSLYNGAVPVSDEFDGIMLFQRRRNGNTISIGGQASKGALRGAIYARWALVNVSGQGGFDAHFIVGRLDIAGNGTVNVEPMRGATVGRAGMLYLVE